jgi:hypothetical protein
VIATSDRKQNKFLLNKNVGEISLVVLSLEIFQRLAMKLAFFQIIVLKILDLTII